MQFRNLYRRNGSYGGERARLSHDEYRYWLHAENPPPIDHERFVIVSYNILADRNVWNHRSELYWHVPPFLLDWDARKRKLVRELGLWSPDIICFQEVDYYEDLNEELQKEYIGVYTARTGEAHDGCAIFWRKNRFELLEVEHIKFKDHDLRDNVAQLCVLQSTSKTLNCTEVMDKAGRTISRSCDSKNNRVIVGNIHVLFNPKRGDVKLGQARVLLEKAHAICEKWGNAPLAIAGDFNSTPWSALYEFITSSQLDLAFHDRRNISGQEEDQNDGFKRNEYNPYKYEGNGRTLELSQKAAAQGKEGAESGEDAGAVAGGKAGDEALSEQVAETRDEVGTVSGLEAEGEVGAESGVEAEVEVGTESGGEVINPGTKEEFILESVRSMVSLKITDKEESAVVTIGELDLVTETSQLKTTRVTLETETSQLKTTKVTLERNPKSTRVQGWDESELMTSTGERHLSIVRHKLNLRSAYSEIKGKPGSRDERGEPFVTSYHKRFKGTVDYIWHTDELCTVRVLDTLPFSVLQRCGGLPSKKWGSDHLALACEFSFVPSADVLTAGREESESESG